MSYYNTQSPQQAPQQAQQVPPARPPPFIFSIKEIRPADGWQQEPGGNWSPPPLEKGASRDAGSQTWGKFYYFDGTYLHILKRFPDWASYQNVRGQCSLYTDGESNIWSYPGDATTAPHDPNTYGYMTWHSLAFFHPDPHKHSERNKPSLLQHGGEYPKLHVQRADQDWVQELLPLKFHTSKTSENPHRGGLAGELWLILGLIGLSASCEGNAIERAFMECFGSGQWPWNLPEAADRAGWQLSRGVVVHVWGIHGWETSYDRLQEGELGKFFA